MLRARPQCHLYLLVLLQRLRKLGRVREVEIAKTLQRQMRHLWIIAHKPAEVLDKLGPELRHLHVDGRAELLADATVGMAGGGVFIGGVTFDHQNLAVKTGHLGQPPCD